MLRSFALPLSVIALSVAIAIANGSEALQYQRDAIADGAWWRLISGHLVHLNWQHLVLNCVALLIIWELFFRPASALRGYCEWLLLSVCVGLGLFVLTPAVQWYVGLSGILHGLFAIGALREWPRRRLLAGGLVAGLAVKLAWEQWMGSISTSMLAGSPVIIDAHLYGAVGGIAIGLLESAWQRYRGNPLAPKTNS